MRKHTILFLASDPFETERSVLEREASAIHAELERSGQRDCFEFVTRWAVAPLDLLRELRKLRPTVVHFSGRRAQDAAGEPMPARSPDITEPGGDDGEWRHGLFLQGPEGGARFVSAAALAETFGAAGPSVKLVVLSACYCEVQAAALLAHVDCVVGTRSSRGHHAARSFAIGFYGGLGERESIAAAYRQGRAAVSLEGWSDRERPQLKVRDGVDANRLVLAAEPTSPDDAGSTEATRDRYRAGTPVLMIGKGTVAVTDTTPPPAHGSPVIVWRDLPPPEAMDIFRMLDWRARATPLLGREREMQQLMDWADSAPAIRARFLIGRGGAGKTRLALETADQLRAQGWTAGQIFLDRESAIPITGKGLFLVVDYPEANREQVQVLLRELARIERSARPIRTLLLTRMPLKEWIALIDAADAAGMCDMQELPSLAIAGGQLFHAAARRFADHVHQPLPEISDAALAHWFARDELQGLPMFIVAAALHCVITRTSELSLTGSEVVAALVRREVKRLDKAGRNAHGGEHTASRIVGLAAAADGLSGAAIRRLAADDEFGLPASQPVNAVKSMGLWQDNCVPPPTPDIVAAELLFEILEASPDSAAAWLWASLADSAPTKVDGLGRITYDIATLRGPEALVRFANWLADSIAGQPERAAQWRVILERETPIGVTRLAVAIGRTLLTRSDLDQLERATILANLSQRLSETGDLHGALQHSIDATDIWRDATARDFERFGAELARSLSTLAMCLRDQGESSDGATIAEEAVDIWQALVETTPDLHEPDLARSLRVWSICLAESGRHSKALELSKQTVDIWRKLSAANARLYEPELARSLNSLSVDLSHSKAEDAAIEAIRQSIALWEKLVDEAPGRYEPELALALNNLSRNLHDRGVVGGAAQAIRRAIRIYGRVISANPARYGLRLAQSFENLSRDLREIGDAKASIAALRDAVELKQRLAAAEPSRFGPGTAERLGRLSLELSSARDDVSAAALLETIGLAEETVVILLVRGDAPSGGRIFAYVALKAARLEEFMAAQTAGTFYPEHFGVILESGDGEPPPDVRDRMEREYGFNHERMIDIPDAEKAFDISRNLKPP